MKRFAIKRCKTIRQKVHEYLRDEILTGNYPAGVRLVEAEIGNRVGASRTPVREALQCLERERLITSIPKVGYIVSEINEKELDELCELRLALESLALQWAMQNEYQKLIASLQENIRRTELNFSNGDITSFVETDSEFHATVSNYSNSIRLQEIGQNLRSYMRRYRLQSIYTKENVERAINGHKAVLLAIEAGDVKSAQKALCDHIVQGRNDMMLFGLTHQRSQIRSSYKQQNNFQSAP